MDDEKRVRLLRAYLRELTYLCRARYRGDFDRMPRKVKVNWTSVLRRSKVRGLTPEYVSRVVGHAPDSLWDRT